MTRKIFLTLASIIGLAVSAFAVLAPQAFLASKGVLSNPAASVWMQETGLLIGAISLLGFLVRAHPDSATLRAVLFANVAVQLGLLPIEIVAFARGVIPVLAGIVPNSVLHVLLAAGFFWFARQARSTEAATARISGKLPAHATRGG